jgi:ribonuclease P protein component
MDDVMIPPEDKGKGIAAAPPEASPAVSLCVIAKRADFLKAAAARRQGTNGFLLQSRDRGDEDPAIRVGFTASKKIGNAVLRNRAKRRLRAIAREVLPALGLPGRDYVLVARPETTVTRPYAELLQDLITALSAVHGGR